MLVKKNKSIKLINTEKLFVKYIYNLKWQFSFFCEKKYFICNFILWRKAEFSAVISPVLSHDPSEIIQICWFCAHKNMSYY